MEAFCSEVIADIREAESEIELIKVIGRSMTFLRKEQNSFKESGFIMNMIASLYTIDIKPLPLHTRQNIQLAIAIFKQFQKESHERIF
ncbi:MAG TPA: hypothetical protein VIN08_14485 [Ohtaekwangia sp.]|uniref:hypothetical protein n=1 Tax=Ohtaekwangia sp. TaxID=2066019 RepID=UPI002F950BE3